MNYRIHDLSQHPLATAIASLADTLHNGNASSVTAETEEGGGRCTARVSAQYTRLGEAEGRDIDHALRNLARRQLAEAIAHLATLTGGIERLRLEIAVSKESDT